MNSLANSKPSAQAYTENNNNNNKARNVTKILYFHEFYIQANKNKNIMWQL